MYKEAIQSEQCEAIHLTKVFRDDIECDAFFPELDPKTWRAWAASTPRRDGDTRYSFVSYVRGPTTKDAADWRLPTLPSGAPSQHEELQVGKSHLSAFSTPGHTIVEESVLETQHAHSSFQSSHAL